MVLDRPLKPLTNPPEDMDISYLPSSERLIVMGRRLETSSRRPSLTSHDAGVFGEVAMLGGVGGGVLLSVVGFVMVLAALRFSCRIGRR